MALASIEQLLRDGQVWAADTGNWTKSFHDSGGIKIPISPLQEKKGGRVSAKFGVHGIDSCLPDGGLRCGALHEFFSKGAALAEYPPCTIPALLAGSLFSQKSSRYTVWIGKECWPSPFLLKKIAADSAAGGGDFVSSCLFIDPADQKAKFWSIESALKTQGVGTVIAQCQNLRFNLSRRFTLAAEEGDTLGLLLRKTEHAKTPSTARTCWSVSAHPSNSSPAWELELLKCKGRRPQHTKWLIELQDETQVSLHISSEMVDRSVLPAARKRA